MFDTNKKRLLALDGGGILGVISLGALRKIESDLRAATGNPRLLLRDYFDYIAGTSTGAIIATGLALGKTVDEIEAIYVEEGAMIFDRRSRIASLFGGMRSRFSHEKLTQRLKEEFTDLSLADLQRSGRLATDKHLMVITRNVETDSPWPVTTNPNARYNDPSRPDCNLNITAWQLARASAAAPTYFAPEHLQWDIHDPDKQFWFEDGGVTPYNNPAFLLFRMATSPVHRCNWPTGEERLMMISVGTSYSYRLLADPDAGGETLLQTATSLPGELMRGIAIENDINCRTFGRCVAGAPIDREIGDMIPAPDDTTPRLFTYARYDLELTHDLLHREGLASMTPEDFAMDNVDAVGGMQVLGRALGRQVDMGAQFPGFLS